LSSVNVGENIPLSFFAEDEKTGLFVRANVYDADGSEIAGSPVTLSEVAGGIYENDTLVMPDSPKVIAKFKAFNDVGLSSVYMGLHPASSTLLKKTGASDVISKLDTIISSLQGFSGTLSTVTTTINTENPIEAAIEMAQEIKAEIESSMISAEIETDQTVETKVDTDPKIKAELEDC